MGAFRRGQFRLAAVSLCALAALASAALAQDGLGLRGAKEKEKAPVILPPPARSADPYRPISPGALPATEDAEPAEEDPFDEAEAASPRAPSTGAQRVEARAGREAPVPSPRPPADGEEPGPPPPANPRAEPAEGVSDAAEDEEDTSVQARALRAAPVEAAPPQLAPEEDPFAPLGLRVGGFILRPSVETGLGASTNASNTAGGRSGTFSETTLRLQAESDWSRHQAEIDAYGTWRETLSGEDVDELEGGVDARALWDLAAGWRGSTTLSYAVGPESAASPNAVAEATERPLKHSLRATAGLDKELGFLRLGATAGLERDWYGDAALADGTTLSQGSRDSTLAALTLRAGYALSPAVTPFVEVEGGRRMFDEERDAAGIERSATRLALRGGVALDLGEKLGGELAAGVLRETFDDDGLEAIEGLSLRADLRWSPVRGTTVSLRGTTSVEGATAAGESGSLVQDVRLQAEREMRANLTGFAALGLSFRDYAGSDGRDLTLFGEAGLTWWLNRGFGVTGRTRHERLESNLAGRDYDASSVFLGVTVRR